MEHYEWDRLDEESDSSYYAFREWLALGPGRNMDSYVSFYSKDNNSHISEWYDNFDWLGRSELYDEFILKNIKDEDERSLLFLEKRQKGLLESMRILAEKNMRKMINRNEDELTSYDLVRLIEVSIKLEQLLSSGYSEVIKVEQEIETKMETTISVSDEMLREIGRKLVEEKEDDSM